jgi:hypothetical protein
MILFKWSEDIKHKIILFYFLQVLSLQFRGCDFVLKDVGTILNSLC